MCAIQSYSDLHYVGLFSLAGVGRGSNCRKKKKKSVSALNIYKKQLVLHRLWIDVHTCLSVPDIWAADVLNKRLNM